MQTPRWPPWMLAWRAAASRTAGSSNRWVVPWRSLCRLRPPLASWAGTVGSTVQSQAYGWVKALVNTSWRHPGALATLWHTAPALRQRRWRRIWPPPLRVGADGVMVPFARPWPAYGEDTMARSQSGGCWPLGPASHAHRQGRHALPSVGLVAVLGDIDALSPCVA